MSDQESTETVETHISQPQWLPNNFMVGTALEGDDSFFEALAQGMNLLSISYGPFRVKSLRQACSEYAEDHQDWHEVIIEDALEGGYATSSGPQADFDSYLLRIKLTAKDMSVLKIAGPAVRGRTNIEGHMLCHKYGMKLHFIKKHTTDSEEVVHELVDSEGSRSISVDETVRLYSQPHIIHILSERWTHFVPVLPKTIAGEEPNEKQGHMTLLEGAYSQQNQLDGIALHPVQSFVPVSGVIHSTQMLSLSDTSSPKSKLDLIDKEENAVGAKNRSVGLLEEPQYQEIVDEFQFGDLNLDSQKKLLEKTVKFQGTEIALNTLMCTDSAITKTLPLASLIEGKKLEFARPVPVSHGYDESFYIGRTLNFQSDENPTSYSAENLDNLMLQAQHQVSLISDGAGMGKTTILTHLSKQIKQYFPSHWVVRIDLNDHTDALKAQNEQKLEAVEFLSQRLLKFDSPFEQELFEQRLKEGKVVVMLDGFDEISPSYERTVIHLLQALKEMSVHQLWVTTRPHLRETLEKNLKVHSYTLEPFSKGNQVEFLTKFWRQKLNLQGTSQQQLEMYATAIIEKLEQSIKHRAKEFTGVPLLTRLLAEAFDQSYLSGHNLPDKLDLVGLYKRFTKRKYDIYWEEKMKSMVSNVAAEEQKECDFRTVTEEYQRLALQVLFPKEGVRIFKDLSQSVFKPQRLVRYGIVHYTDKKPHFIHRTFAEYYVADFLIEKLSKETTPDQELLDFLLKDILLNENDQVIGSFLDGFLENCKLSERILEPSGKRICELWTDNSDGSTGQNLLGSLGRTVLHQAAQEGHAHIIRYLLDSLKAGNHLETMHGLFVTRDEMGQTAWHLSAENDNLKTSEELWDWAKEAKVNLKDDLLLAKDRNDQTAFHLAAWNKRSKEVMIKLLRCAAEAELSQEELKNLLLAKDKEGKTIWHLAAWKNYSHVFQSLMEWAKKVNLNQQEFKAVLLAKDDEGRTPWHSATLNNHPEVYKWVNKVIKNPQEQKKLLKKLFLHKDKGGQTIWHLAARSIHPDVFKKLLDVAEKALNKEELQLLLLTKDMMGQTAWHLSAENGSAESLNTLWEWAIKVNLNENELKNNWLLSQDPRGTAWHLAAHRGRVTVLKKLWDWTREMNLNIKEDLLLLRDVLGRTAWHLAAEMGNTETLEEIFDWAKEAKLNFEVDLLLAKDMSGKTPLELLKECAFISDDKKAEVLQRWNCYLPDV